jgi:polyisoprenoid-binding protein YceI
MRGLVAAIALMAQVGIYSAAQAETVKIDTSASVLKWVGSKVVGGSHTGSLSFQSGEIEYVGAKPVSAKLVVDMSSLKNEDLTDAAMNKKLVGHLLSEDFFNAAKFPTATLVISKIEAQAPGQYELGGELTIIGKTKPIRLKATESTTTNGKSVISEFKFDRTDFDLKYGSGKFFKNLGDKMISDEVSVAVKLELPASNTSSAKK